MHTMQAPETLTTAEGTAAFFARGTVTASAHFSVDADSVVQCVREADTAYHAPPNRYSIGIELAGFAEQNMSDWSDAYSVRMLDRAARLVSELCARHGVPLRWLSITDLQAGRRGVTSHGNVAKAFGQSNHWDPGPAFPVDAFLAKVARVVTALSADEEGAIVVPPPSPPVTLSGGRKMRQLVPIGPLDADGRGWLQTSVDFAAFEAVTVNAQDPGPRTEGGAGAYGPAVNAAACDHGGKTRVVVQGGQPGTVIAVYVTASV